MSQTAAQVEIVGSESRLVEVSPSGLIALVVSAVCVGVAIHLHDGEYLKGNPDAISLITCAIVAAVAGVCVPRLREIGLRHVVWFIAGALLIQFVALFRAWPG